MNSSSGRTAFRRTELALNLFLVASLASCGGADSSGPSAGTLSGAVSANVGGPLVGVEVMVTPTDGSGTRQTQTTGIGTYTLGGVPAGSGTIAVSTLPANCTTPSIVAYNLPAGGTESVNIAVMCVASVGVVVGIVASTFGDPLAGVSVTVAPMGGTALATVVTGWDGAYSVSGVATGGGSVSVSGLSGSCVVPPPAAYSGLAFNGSKTVDVTVNCGPRLGRLSGIISSSLGGSLEGVTVTAHPDSGGAPPTAITDVSGAYTLSSVPVGNGTLSLAGLPANCPTPIPVPYSGVTLNGTLTKNVTVVCTPLTGTIVGKVSPARSGVPGSAGGGIPAAYVTVQPTAGSSFSVTAGGTGSYSVTGIPTGGGTVSVARRFLTATVCQAKSVNYSGLQAATTDTVNISVDCTGELIVNVRDSRDNSPLPNAGISVTSSDGQFIFAQSNGSPAIFISDTDSGTIALSGLTGARGATCQVPASPTPYSGLATAATTTVTITVVCTGP